MSYGNIICTNLVQVKITAPKIRRRGLNWYKGVFKYHKLKSRTLQNDFSNMVTFCFDDANFKSKVPQSVL